MSPAPHAKLDAYERALETAALLARVGERLPSGRTDLKDQLQRAAASIVLNLAEGAAEFSAPEKVRFYRMARRSAAECFAVLDLAEAVASKVPESDEARAKLDGVMAMLTRLMQSVKTR